MQNTNDTIKQYKGAFPAFGSYIECMSRTFLTGLSAFSLAFGGTYIAQHLTSKHLPYDRKLNILFSSIAAVAVSYKVTSVRTHACQQAWMAAEDKHTFLNPISERPKPDNEEEES